MDPNDDTTREARAHGGWLVFGLGVVIGSWMVMVLVAALLRDPMQPNLGWGVVALLWLQPLALLLTFAGAAGVVANSDAGGRTIAILAGGMVYTLLPYLAAGTSAGC